MREVRCSSSQYDSIIDSSVILALQTEQKDTSFDFCSNAMAFFINVLLVATNTFRHI